MDQVFILQQIIAYTVIISSSIFLYFCIKKNVPVYGVFLGYLIFWMSKYYLEALAVESVQLNATDKALAFSILWTAFVSLTYFLYNRYYAKK